MRDAIKLGIDVSVIPGPSAVTMAVALAGLPTDRFTFEGFAPRASGARLAAFEKLRHEERTMVFFEAPHRLGDSLGDAVSVFGAERLGAICREMTKRYEETIRGNLSELSMWADANEVLGEITLVIAGASADSATLTADEMVARVREFEGAGMDRKAAIASVAQEFGIAKRIVYAAVVDANKISP
jgi:16S rRNA (cytidine1402-2'-O)-methyltransferase